MTEIAVGIDIGGTNTRIGLVDRQGKVLLQDVLGTHDYDAFPLFLDALVEKIRGSLHKCGADCRLVGIGVGAPKANYFHGTIENAANLPWKEIIPFSELMKKRFPVPVVLTNDANAAAVGEMVYGGARGMKNFVVLTLGTGLGSGFVVDGKLMYGEYGFAGELGHTSVLPGISHRECTCGLKGCLETYISATGIKRTLLKIMADSISPSPLRDVSFNQLNAKMIYDAARKGDPIATQAFARTGQMLGIKLADVVAHTNPEAIFLFGGLAEAGDLLFEPAKTYMEKHMLSVYRSTVKLLPSRLNAQNAPILGASSLVWDEINT